MDINTIDLSTMNPNYGYREKHRKFYAKLRSAKGGTNKEVWIGNFDTEAEAREACERVISGEPIENVRPKRRGWSTSKSGVRDIHFKLGKFVPVYKNAEGQYRQLGSCETIAEARKILDAYNNGTYDAKKEFGSIYFYPPTGKWNVKFFEKNLGYYETENEAKKVLEDANNGIFPEPKKLGRPKGKKSKKQTKDIDLSKLKPAAYYNRTYKKYIAKLRSYSYGQLHIGSFDSKQEALEACERVLAGESIEAVRPKRVRPK